MLVVRGTRQHHDRGTFDPGVQGRDVAAAVLEVLAVVYDVDAREAFTLAGNARGLGDDARFGFVAVGDEVYRLG